MPELPEVETIKRQLAPLVQGKLLQRLEVLDPRWSRPLEAAELGAALEGRLIERLGRRGKYLLWSFDGDMHLAQHLRMTGSLLWEPCAQVVHARVRMHLTNRRGAGRRQLVVSDPRRFGTGQLLVGADALEAFLSARLGLEPLDDRFTAAHLRTLTRGRRRPIKSLLLDQRWVAGVGNIYADEALFRAGVHPLRPAGRLTAEQHQKLRAGLIAALVAGIDAKGASVDDFRHVDGMRGGFQEEFLVHRRAGEPCPRCGEPIVKMVVGGRGTYVCESCQRRPRAGKARPAMTSRS
jgi:formamidopyrimidine-DNA glycosylase